MVVGTYAIIGMHFANVKRRGTLLAGDRRTLVSEGHELANSQTQQAPKELERYVLHSPACVPKDSSRWERPETHWHLSTAAVATIGASSFRLHATETACNGKFPQTKRHL